MAANAIALLGAVTLMKDADGPNLDRLKLHFAQRVTHQARYLLEIWQHLQQGAWDRAALTELGEGCARLLRYAERFEQTEHIQLAQAIGACVAEIEHNQGRLSSHSITELSRLMQRLARTGLRHSDQSVQPLLNATRKPVYVALADTERASELVRQLDFFGVNCLLVQTRAHFHQAMTERHPAAIVMDIDFAGPSEGLRLADELSSVARGIAWLFFASAEPSTAMRLAAVRSGGGELFCENLEASKVLECIEAHTQFQQYEPYRVMIIDDSKAQATHTERTLNSAGIVTCTLTEPFEAMDRLAEFEPDLIILDMYMPECKGTELATVIRQNEHYVSVPIIYLSAEDDLEKQLDAMNTAGDDFLTKPIKARHLITTVRNRAERARQLRERMVRDSLTGLYNHTHSLHLLENACKTAQREQRPLSFVMLDIDHFKSVNDQYGHPVGDRVIKTLALFLKQRLRKTDHIGRYGGEEFAVIMPDTDAKTAAYVIDSIRQRFAEIHYPNSQAYLTCTFSAGVAQHFAGMDAGRLTQTADLALYKAKHNGRNQVVSSASIRPVDQA